MTTLGIDLGTGSVKAAVVSADGRMLGEASRSYEVVGPEPGWAQSDPLEWLAAVNEVVARVSAKADRSIEAVGFSGQMHGVVVTDGDLVPLLPAILWADARASAEVVDLAESFSVESLASLGSPAVPGFAATTLKWLHRNRPEVIDSARYALQPKDWLRAALGGDIATDPSDASGTLLYDVVAGRWSADAIAWTGVDRSLLPEVKGSSDPAGTVSFDCGVKAPAVVGGADTACAMAGIGLRVGSGFIAVGTGSQTVSVLDQPSLDTSLVTHTFATLGAVGAGWYRIGAVQNAGLSLTKALAWLGADIAEAVEALRTGIRASDPIFVPYLAGERTPFMDASLRGAWAELSLATDRPAMLRSILEGVAQAVALGVQAVEATGARLPTIVPIVGGGTHDPAFRQLLANATGHVLGVTDAPNAAVIGAALLAQGRTCADQPAEVSSVVEPEQAVLDLLTERRERMVALVRTQEPREHP